ncbi:MAG: carboxypeptidase-like regulatory domain-containing protein [Bacteroidota bacterium]
MKRSLILVLAILLISFQLYAQSNDKLVQFSGVVVASDSLQPVPFASVMIRNTNRGTVTDFYGFFSFVAIKGDTVEFAYLGYKKGQYIIPDSLMDKRYSLIQVLVRDTLTLKETVIFPWPSKEEFRRAFLELQVPDNDLARAERNLELAELKEVKDGVPYDGSINYKYAMQQQQSRLYTAGQYPTSNLFNPLAWAQFIKAWKEGAFKKKD